MELAVSQLVLLAPAALAQLPLPELAISPPLEPAALARKVAQLEPAAAPRDRAVWKFTADSFSAPLFLAWRSELSCRRLVGKIKK